MNERIRELVKQAGIPLSSIQFSGIPIKYEVAESELEKLAELIVKECIGCCEQVISDPVPESVDTWLNGGEQCIQEIKEHFGIKE